MSGRIDGFLIDALTVEEHRYAAAVTDHPVETGADISDHVRVIPVVVTVQGIVSNTPLPEAANERAADQLPADTAREHFKRIRLSREPIIIETSTGVFENMVMQSYTESANSSSGDAFNFRASFKQIQLVTNARTFVTVKLPKAKRKRSLGNKASKKKTDAEVPKKAKETSDTYNSLLKRGIKAAF